MTTHAEPFPTRAPLTARPTAFFAALVAVLVVVVLAALRVGSMHIDIADTVAIIASLAGRALPTDLPAERATVLLSFRFPRVLLGAVAGGGLAASGAALQAMFRNPLADPTLIGVSSGAALAVSAATVVAPAFGASLVGTSIMHAVFPWLLPLAGFVGGLAATALLYRLATFEGATSLATMLLAGIAINALAFAGIGLLTTIATNEQLRSIAFWNFGSLAGGGWDTVAVVTIAVVVGIAWLQRMAPGLNAFALGEIEARHLGIATERVKRGAIMLAALMAGFVVAACGVIGFVALVAPHVARSLGGADNRVVVPASALIGAILLVGADLVGRTTLAPVEWPIGVVTALVGAPFFLWLLVGRRGLPS